MQKTLAIIIGGIVALSNNNVFSADSVPVPQPQYPLILWQPDNQTVPFGASATFTVTAENADGYQWFRNGNPLDNQTNNTLIISNVGIPDVGYYSCDVFKDMEFVPTRSASLLVYSSSIDPQTGVDPMIVYAFPLSGKGSQGSCPGTYAGYVNYSPGGTNGWGWAPNTSNGNNIFTASDTNRANTKIEYFGEYGDGQCNQTSVTVPNPPISPAYTFMIFFTNNVPTNAYPVTISGFYP